VRAAESFNSEPTTNARQWWAYERTSKTGDIMNPNTHQYIGRLERLVADLRLLAEMPVLDARGVSRRAEVCLIGIPFGHPTLPDGEEIVTSQVFGLYEESGANFIRTLSPCNRLGRRAKA
jgi:hypothetical protein